jgi:cell division septation protein DedD
MRFWIFLLLAGPVAAETLGPLEQPPEDFAGAQYIDSAGCVYLRQGSVWAPRLDRDGTVICGYPPSLPTLSTPTDGGHDAALRLSVTLAEGLRNSDLRDDPADPLRREPVEPKRPNTDQLADLNASLRSVSAMRAAAVEKPGGSTPLCALLGYDEAGPDGGNNQTLGFCGGGSADLQPISAATRRDDDGAGAAEVDLAARSPTARKPQAEKPKPQPPAAGSHLATAGSGASGAVVGKDGSAKGAARTAERVPPDLIAAGARYVQVGRYADPAAAEAVILRLVGAGYPVARGRRPDAEEGGRLILVGPFADRQALATALGRLRQSGYPKAVAR